MEATPVASVFAYAISFPFESSALTCLFAIGAPFAPRTVTATLFTGIEAAVQPGTTQVGLLRAVELRSNFKWYVPFGSENVA
jgi:hypothetical protein